MNNLSELLLEAADLLTEAARYRKEIKDKDGNSSYLYGRKAAKAMAEYKDDKDELRKGAARMKYYTTSSRPHRNRKTYTNMSKEEREQMYNDIVAKTAIDYTDYNTNKDLGKNLSDYNNDKLNRKIALIEKRKNRKSQNESIAVLLTEAAELLNEDSNNIEKLTLYYYWVTDSLDMKKYRLYRGYKDIKSAARTAIELFDEYFGNKISINSLSGSKKEVIVRDEKYINDVLKDELYLFKTKKSYNCEKRSDRSWSNADKKYITKSIYAITSEDPEWVAEKINSPIETIIKLAGYEYKCNSLKKEDISGIVDIIKSTKFPEGIYININKIPKYIDEPVKVTSNNYKTIGDFYPDECDSFEKEVKNKN